MAATQKRAPVFLAFFEEAATSPRLTDDPHLAKGEPGANGAGSDVAGPAGPRTAGRALVARPSAAPRDNPFRPTRVVSGEGPVARPRAIAVIPTPEPGRRIAKLTREEAHEVAREVARELAYERTYVATARADARLEPSMFAVELESRVGLPDRWRRSKRTSFDR
ncbi:hypothetical protein L6R52_16275 [Myxococcota bacterium]|nr:hypothetical protein [Myxococcota bacterium]